MDLIRTRSFEFQLVLSNFQLVTRNWCFTISQISCLKNNIFIIKSIFYQRLIKAVTLLMSDLVEEALKILMNLHTEKFP